MGGWRVGRGTVGIPARAPAITNAAAAAGEGKPYEFWRRGVRGKGGGGGKGQGQGGASSALWRILRARTIGAVGVELCQGLVHWNWGFCSVRAFLLSL
jgi:hypothetical protein